jgi:glutamate--cysteine ligase
VSAAERAILTCEKLVEYFEQAFKPRDEWLVGIEMERMARTRTSGSPLPYDGDAPSVRRILERLLERLGGSPVFEGNHLIGLDGPMGSISLEPGGQVEWSSRPATDLAVLGRDVDAFLQIARTTADDLGLEWLEVGVDPTHALEQMIWMPKARYKIMRPYMGARGRLSHRMMTQTASIQCAFDFDSAADWTNKFRAGVLLAPVTVALFANSADVDGGPSGYRSYRQAIWRETTPERCGIPDVVFRPDFGIERWVEWVCTVPSMFRYRHRGLVPAGGVPFTELLELHGCDALKTEDWELHLSSIFTEVRSYSYIEVRSADLQPEPLIMAVPTFWTGVLYDPDALAAALELGKGWDSHDAWTEAMHAASRDGLDGSVGGRSLREVAGRALELAAAGLRNGATCGGDAAQTVAPLAELARRHELDIEI